MGLEMWSFLDVYVGHSDRDLFKLYQIKTELGP